MAPGGDLEHLGRVHHLGSSWRSATGSSCGCTCPGPSWPTRSSASPSQCRGSAGGSPEEGEIERYLMSAGNCLKFFSRVKSFQLAEIYYHIDFSLILSVKHNYDPPLLLFNSMLCCLIRSENGEAKCLSPCPIYIQA